LACVVVAKFEVTTIEKWKKKKIAYSNSQLLLLALRVVDLNP